MDRTVPFSIVSTTRSTECDAILGGTSIKSDLMNWNVSDKPTISIFSKIAVDNNSLGASVYSDGSVFSFTIDDEGTDYKI